MTEQEKQEIIAEVKVSVMDEHRCVCKADYLRRTERRYRLRMSIVWQTGNVRCRE